jgi:hypothetical protein
MRHRLLLLAASGSALALAMMSFPAVGASGVAKATVKAPHIGSAVTNRAPGAEQNSPRVAIPTLYNQNSLPNGVAVESQNFEPLYYVYTSQGADDFVVPAGHTWTVQEVDITAIEYIGPAIAAGIEFYADSGSGSPGSPVSIQTAKVKDVSGAISILLPAPVTLGAGAYWVSVYADQDYEFHSQFFWETRTAQKHNGAMWRNPADGFATTCTSFTTLGTCVAAGQGPDFMFRLRGTTT